MSINFNDSVEDLAFALAELLDEIELYANPFVLEQAHEPSQADWEAAWVLAGNTLPIPEDQELYWKTNDVIRGQFGRTNDRFYCIFPSNSVSIEGVSHFAYTKFLGWEDDQHFLFSGTQLNDAGAYTGLLRAYLDGSLEQVDFTGFTANTLLGYDEAQGKLWYIEGTDLKRIDTTTEAITVIASGITVAPTEIAFDGAGDAFCTINIGAGLDLYRWNNGATTFTSFKASITVNGVGEDPGQVITASLNYVLVLSSVSNYWVQIARAGGAETQIKSNPAGATGDNLPQPDATTWVQTFAGRTLDVLSIVYTELTGNPSIGEWRRILLWDMGTATYTENTTLPYDDFIAMCIAEAPSLDPLNYDARRDITYHTLTSAYRKRVSTAWEYHNISGVRANIALSRQILETDDGQIFVWSNGSSGKIWRLSVWDQGESDVVLLTVIPMTGVEVVYIDLSDRPEGYDYIEIAYSSGGNDGGAVANGLAGVAIDSAIRVYNIDVDANTYTHTASLGGRGAVNSTQGSILVSTLLLDQDTSIYPHSYSDRSSANTGVVNATVTYVHAMVLLNIAYGLAQIVPTNSEFGIGGYLIVRAFRTRGRRQGASYYDPSMA